MPDSTETIGGVKNGNGNKVEDSSIVLGSMLESVEAQVGMLVLILLDICASIFETQIQQSEDCRASIESVLETATTNVDTPSLLLPNVSWGMRLVQRLLTSFTSFTMLLFVAELFVLASVFKKMFVHHLGYVLDVVVLVIILVVELFLQSKVIRLLSFFRFWRILRLVNTLVGYEKEAHASTMQELEQQQATIAQLQVDKSSLQSTLQTEETLCNTLTDELQLYKDEVDTLQEALHIAAEAFPQSDNQTSTAKSKDPKLSDESIDLEDKPAIAS